MIITVTLNPAVDKTITLTEFKLAQLNRANEVRKDIGGKGINVSQVISNLAGKSTALGFLGGSSGKMITKELDKAEIKHKFTWLAGETRTNLKIVDQNKKEITEINEAGIAVNKEDLTKLKDKILKEVDKDDFVILAGSLPPKTPDDFYQKLTTELKKIGAKVVVDTSDQPLVEAVTAKPYLIKPNLAELEELVNQKLHNTEQIIKAGKKIYQQGVEIVVISLGKEGSIVVSQAGIYRAKPPKVTAKSTVGAGDTLVGALIYKLSQNSFLKEAIKYATAASANSVSKAGTKFCVKTEVEDLLEQVEIKQLTIDNYREEQLIIDN